MYVYNPQEEWKNMYTYTTKNFVWKATPNLCRKFVLNTDFFIKFQNKKKSTERTPL